MWIRVFAKQISCIGFNSRWREQQWIYYGWTRFKSWVPFIQGSWLQLLLMKSLYKGKDYCWVNTVMNYWHREKFFSITDPSLTPSASLNGFSQTPSLSHALSLSELLRPEYSLALSLCFSISLFPQLHNKGPSAISSTVLEVGWPSRYKDEHILYALEIETDGPVTCRANSSLNPLDLEVGRAFCPSIASSCGQGVKTAVTAPYPKSPSVFPFRTHEQGLHTVSISPRTAVQNKSWSHSQEPQICKHSGEIDLRGHYEIQGMLLLLCFELDLDF